MLFLRREIHPLGGELLHFCEHTGCDICRQPGNLVQNIAACASYNAKCVMKRRAAVRFSVRNKYTSLYTHAPGIFTYFEAYLPTEFHRQNTRIANNDAESRIGSAKRTSKPYPFAKSIRNTQSGEPHMPSITFSAKTEIEQFQSRLR